MLTTVTAFLWRCTVSAAIPLLLLLLLLVVLHLVRLRSSIAYTIRSRRSTNPSTVVVGVLHPYSAGGGGGERVLWWTVRALQDVAAHSLHDSIHSDSGGDDDDDGHHHHQKKKKKDVHIVLYTGMDTTDPHSDGSSASEWCRSLEQTVRHQFGISLLPTPTVQVLPVTGTRRLYALASVLPFTLLLQALASLAIAFEAVMRCPPDLLVDTTGLAFGYPAVRLLCPQSTTRIATYTHYPVISTDMLGRVQRRTQTYNNSRALARSTAATAAKVVYYRILARLYGLAGRTGADCVMVNSTWTHAHIASLWYSDCGTGRHTHEPPLRIVYPPVSVAHLSRLPLHGRQRTVLSVGQFRPEKDHMLQLEAFALFLQQHPQYTANDQDGEGGSGDRQVRLCMLGGCRGAEDEARVDGLRRRARELGIDGQVQFMVNVSFDVLSRMLGESLVGLHTMRDEHFGICVVEYMAAGLIPLAHRSGGPLADIVVPDSHTGQKTGFLAETAQEYADALFDIVHGYFDAGPDRRRELERVQQAARASAARFSEERFVAGVTEALAPLVASVSRL